MKHKASDFKKKNPFVDDLEKMDSNKEIFTPNKKSSHLKPKLFSPPDVEDQEIYEMNHSRETAEGDEKDNQKQRRKRLFKDFYSMLKDDRFPLDSGDVGEKENHESQHTGSSSNREENKDQDPEETNAFVEEFNDMLTEESAEISEGVQKNQKISHQAKEKEEISETSTQISKRKRNPFKEKVNPFDDEDLESQLNDLNEEEFINDISIVESDKEEESTQLYDEDEQQENPFIEEFSSLLGVEDKEDEKDEEFDSYIDTLELQELQDDDSLESQDPVPYENEEECFNNDQGIEELLKEAEMEQDLYDESEELTPTDEQSNQDEADEITEEMFSMLDDESEDDTSYQFMEDVINTLDELEKSDSFPLGEFLDVLINEFCGDGEEEQSSYNEIRSEQEVEAQEPCMREDPSMHVKLPLKLSNETFQIDLVEWVPLPTSMLTITNIYCTFNRVEASIPLPSSVIFFEGEVLLDIEYETDQATTTLHTVRVPIEWKKSLNAAWKKYPELPEESNMEYTFSGQTETASFCKEWFHKPVNPIVHQVLDAQSLWQFEQESQYLQLNGTLTLSIDLYQTQYVSI